MKSAAGGNLNEGNCISEAMREEFLEENRAKDSAWEELHEGRLYGGKLYGGKLYEGSYMRGPVRRELQLCNGGVYPQVRGWRLYKWESHWLDLRGKISTYLSKFMCF